MTKNKALKIIETIKSEGNIVLDLNAANEFLNACEKFKIKINLLVSGDKNEITFSLN